MSIHRLIALILLSCLAWPSLARAAESYDNCTSFITSVPAVITTQGTWCLNQDLATAITTGKIITIDTNNVTIDCNDFKVGGLAAGVSTSATGIYALNRLNVTVRNCNIRGFYDGLYLQGTAGGGHAVEDNRLDGNTHIGMFVEGDGSVLRRNRITDTGGSTTSPNAYGLLTTGVVDVLDNTISGVQASLNGAARGIDTLSASGATISGNRVRGVFKSGTGLTKGIVNSSSGRLVLFDNQVVGDASTGSVGLECSDANSGAGNNAVGGFATAIKTCSDAGGNFLKP